MDLLCFFLSCVWCAFVCVCLYVPCGHLLRKGWPHGFRLWCLIVSLLLSHWYPGSGVVLDCIDSWTLHPYLMPIGTYLSLFVQICLCFVMSEISCCFLADGAFIFTSRYLDDLLTIDNPYFDRMVIPKRTSKLKSPLRFLLQFVINEMILIEKKSDLRMEIVLLSCLCVYS